ncbi:MAG: hypothetical protein KCHDKBKB_01796 [Elusimicrobia bacterium]|nr:hypothetical protein [Elusimicrobiota bacterium]
MTVHLFLTLFFLGMNTFFVLAEFALVKAQRSRLEVLKNEGRLRAGLVLGMLDNLDNYLSAIQIGVTMSTLALGWAGEPVMSSLFREWFAWPSLLAPYSARINTVLAFCLIIYVQIVFAELVPRSIAIQKAESIALWMSIPLAAFYKALRFPIMLMARSSKFVSRLIGLKPVGEHQEIFTEDEVRVLLGASQEKGLIPLDRLLLIENLFDFEDLKVRDAMVPRDKVVFLSTERSWDENRRTLQNHHFSRYPVGNPDIDHPIGFIHVKDLALLGAGIPDLARLARPLPPVDDGAALQPLLKTMTSQGKHMMLVTRSGKPAGIITLEDVIEELLGEILDEFDAPNAWSFHRLLTPEAIDLDLTAPTPIGAVRSLVERLKKIHPTLDLKNVETAVMSRETQLSTAIGQGVAVPHARVAALNRPLIAVGRSKQPISFTTPDKLPVKLIFLILTPMSSPIDQLRILARIAMLMRNPTLLKQIMKAKTPAQFLDVIGTSESIVVG